MVLKLITPLMLTIVLMCFGMAIISESGADGQVYEGEEVAHALLRGAFVGGIIFCAGMIALFLLPTVCPSFGKLIFGPYAHITENPEENENVEENGGVG